MLTKELNRGSGLNEIAIEYGNVSEIFGLKEGGSVMITFEGYNIEL